MLRLGLLAALVCSSACYAPNVPSCAVRCEQGDECPEGTSCQMGYCNPPGVTASTCLVGDDGGIIPMADARVLVVDDGGHPIDDMVVISAGSFQMGCAGPPADLNCYNDEPLHTVTLSEFEIDRTEVPQAAYQLCVDDGACDQPTTSVYQPDVTPQRPAVGIDFAMAEAYCQWAGKRLPTEAEWEKAARGNGDTRVFPWGNQDPACGTHAVYSSCTSEPADVGIHPTGRSPYDVDDMAGNVWEWVSDWYDPDYYETGPTQDPQGPASGSEKILRGGGYQSGLPVFLRVSNRNNGAPSGLDARAPTHGFRCAR